jgi:hypothetical protein
MPHATISVLARARDKEKGDRKQETGVRGERSLLPSPLSVVTSCGSQIQKLRTVTRARPSTFGFGR